MLNAPSTDVLHALASLESDSQFEVVCAWLAGALREIDEQNRIEQSEAKLRQGQGAAQVLAEFERSCATARESLDRIGASRKKAERLQGASL